MKTKSIQRMAVLLAAAGMWLGSSMSTLASITYYLNTVLPGQTVTPAGAPPWAIVTIAQNGNNVDLTISTVGLTANEFITEFDLNYENSGSATLGSLVFTQTPASPTVPIAQGSNGYKADGTGGYFDIELSFPTSPVGDRFTGGKTFSYIISSSLGAVLQDDFLATSTAGFYLAAHIQAIGPNGDSSWGAGSTTPVPEPTTMIAGALLLLPFAASMLRVVRRKRMA